MKPLANFALALMAAGSIQEPQPTELLPPGTIRTLRPFLRGASDDEIRLHAIAMAQEHVQAQTPYVAWAGMVALYRPGITAEVAHLVGDLPKLELPSGCADPLAMKGAWFALAYNGEMVKHLPLVKWPPLADSALLPQHADVPVD
jgi:hypothetical protein